MPIEWLSVHCEWMTMLIEWLSVHCEWMTMPIERLSVRCEWMTMPIECLSVPIDRASGCEQVFERMATKAVELPALYIF